METINPTEKDLNPTDVLDILNILLRNKKLERPRGKESPKFSTEEVGALANLIFRRSPYVRLQVYKRLPEKKQRTVKKELFIRYFFGEARYNGAKAARMAGYSARSAKQIAYRIKHS